MLPVNNTVVFFPTPTLRDHPLTMFTWSVLCSLSSNRLLPSTRQEIIHVSSPCVTTKLSSPNISSIIRLYINEPAIDLCGQPRTNTHWYLERMLSYHGSKSSTELSSSSHSQTLTTRVTNFVSQTRLWNQQKFQKRVFLHNRQPSFWLVLRRRRWSCQFGSHTAHWTIMLSRNLPRARRGDITLNNGGLLLHIIFWWL